MTAWFLALDAEVEFAVPPASAGGKTPKTRIIKLNDFYLGYKQLAKTDTEFISKIRFREDFTDFNFEKVCKRTFLDIASVNTARRPKCRAAKSNRRTFPPAESRRFLCISEKPRNSCVARKLTKAQLPKQTNAPNRDQPDLRHARVGI